MLKELRQTIAAAQGCRDVTDEAELSADVFLARHCKELEAAIELAEGILDIAVEPGNDFVFVQVSASALKAYQDARRDGA